jgi:integrase
MPGDYPRYVIEDIDRHGNVRVYFRRAGQPKYRFQSKFPSPEWWAEYHAALIVKPAPAKAKKTAKPGKDTFRALCAAYQASADFQRLNRATKDQRRRVLDSCCLEPITPDSPDIYGDMPMEHFNADAVEVLRDRKMHAPEAANHRLKTLSQLFKWKKIKPNPVRDVERFKTASGGHHTWTQAELAQFVAWHPPGTKAHLALALFYFTGQRISDVARFGPKHIVGDEIIFTQAKNKDRKPVTLVLPLLPELKALLAEIPKSQKTFLISEWGEPFQSVKSFGNKMRDWCDEAGLLHCSAHGIRKAGATTMAEGGATHKQMMAIFGWSNEKQASNYIRKADQKRLAAQSMGLLRPASTVPLLEPPGKWDKKE